jgi:hypothetical protein
MAPVLLRTQYGHNDSAGNSFPYNLLILLVGAQGLEPWTR